MTTRTATARYSGFGKEGKGAITTQSGVLSEQFYGFNTRFEDEPGTNPEELIGAAHAGCFSMFLSALLSKDGFVPERIHTTATVHLEAGPTIALIELNTEAAVPGIDQAKLEEYAAAAKANCPVSKALASVEIKLNAKLV